jgi:hypothetical protein
LCMQHLPTCVCSLEEFRNKHMAETWPFTNYRSRLCLCLSRTWTMTKMAASPMHQISNSHLWDPWREFS